MKIHVDRLATSKHQLRLLQKDIESIPGGDATAAGQRRYDVDWLRVLALGLLIVYHCVVSFQLWASAIFFPQNEESLEGLWILMSMVNVWRIPVLFLISGMGVRFAMERRDWRQLLKDRTIRILIPFVFGFFVISPIFIAFALAFYGYDLAYVPDPGHLWFLANIYLYVLLLLPVLAYLKNRPDSVIWRVLSRPMGWPLGILLFALPLMLEAWLVAPENYATYAMTSHGFLLGLLCFFFGFAFVSLQDLFWPATERVRWFALAMAFLLYLARLWIFFEMETAFNGLIAFESMCWMLAIFGFASRYLNRPSRSLRYCSMAVYPVYIVHLPVQFFLAMFLFPLALSAPIKLILLLLGTFGISLFLYQYVLRPLKWIRPLFGMKLNAG
jgi:glucan biosynthesis protein C